ncbi:ribokinase [Homoserinibacter sp. GY 40078]|uniref:ribokinase n=1 Tax=Homoserinibacter sp. GY 40078 TaxID=2603275 RepID=UPI0011C96FED|nr:ribokinase [Homoserinibacter sp. GY 40078]TXK18479.1 ribokinase [Homoserinibacter sp. GY 40078]
MSVVVVGSAHLDHVVRVERRPEPGETVFGASFDTSPGGKGLNQAVAVARAGAAVGFIGVVGDDPPGAELREVLQTRAVNVSRLVTAAGATGTAHITVTSDGENSIVVVPGVNAAIDHLDEADRQAISSARVLMLQLERPIGLVAECLAWARRVGVMTVLTPAPVRALDEELLAHVDVLVLNAIEARALTGLTDAVEATRKLAQLVGTVIVTLGAEGARVVDSSREQHVQAPRVEAIDTTGAGDAFTGWLAAGLARGDDLIRAVDLAVEAAALSVTRPGAAESVPDRNEVARWMQARR